MENKLTEVCKFQWSAREYLSLWLPLFNGVDDMGNPCIPVDPIFELIKEKAAKNGFEVDWEIHGADWEEDKVIIYYL